VKQFAAHFVCPQRPLESYVESGLQSFRYAGIVAKFTQLEDLNDSPDLQYYLLLMVFRGSLTVFQQNSKSLFIYIPPK
jgi:hypothetical protein